MTSTNTPAPAQQALLTDDEMIACFKDAIQRARAQGLANAGPHEYVAAGAVAFLSKLRAPVADEREACPTDVCQASKADGVLCANDECDRANGVRQESAPVADESPMAKMADALREKARQEQQTYQDRRAQATEWGPLPEGTEADLLTRNAPVAHVAGDETSRYLDWAKDRSAWEMPVGTPVYYSALASAPVADERVSDDTLWSWAEQIMGGKEAHHVGRDRVLRFARAALASAPVAEVQIGVSVTAQGATVCLMQPHADGSATVIYSETHPIGDSAGRAALASAPVADRQRLRELVDVVWNEATESTAVPDTPWADRLIDKVFPSLAASAPVAGKDDHDAK